MAFQAGDKVTVRAAMYKNRLPWQSRKYYTQWDRLPLTPAVDGIVCGKRTLFSGNHMLDSGYFSKREKHTVYLVAANMAGFLRVLPEDMEQTGKE